MRIKFCDTNLSVKEFLTILERVLNQEGISKLDTPNVYIGSSKKVIQASIKKTEIDHEYHEQDGIESIEF